MESTRDLGTPTPEGAPPQIPVVPASLAPLEVQELRPQFAHGGEP